MDDEDFEDFDEEFFSTIDKVVEQYKARKDAVRQDVCVLCFYILFIGLTLHQTVNHRVSTKVPCLPLRGAHGIRR